jgi:hypothetical protein
MSVYVLFAGAMLSLGCFSLHVLVWRLWRPVNDVRWLLAIFLIMPAAGLLIMPIMSLQWFQQGEALLVAVFHYCLALAYIASYPAAQANSPSLDIMLKVYRTTRHEISEHELVEFWGRRSFIDGRIDDLVTGGLIVKHGNVYRLSWSGRLLLSIYRTYRRFLGISFGEG